MTAANRRGRLPEVHWDSETTFRVALPSRPVVTDLRGQIGTGSPGRISFKLLAHRRPVVLMVLLNLACAVIGPWSTELFIEIYSWYWQPPLCVLAAVWVWRSWPSKALADARTIAPRWIEEIQNRLDNEKVSTSAVA